MGFTLRFIVGFFLVLAICSKSKSASTWRRMKLLSQETTTIEPLDKNNGIVNKSSKNEQQQIPKTDFNSTDETNKIVSEIVNKEEDVEPPVIEDNVDRPFPITESNDLSKESVENGRVGHSKSIDLNINIDKYLSPDFHDKNNVYKVPTSPDTEKYINLANTLYQKSTTPVESTTKYDFDKQHLAIRNDIDKKLSYIDEKDLRSTSKYETTTHDDIPDHINLIKYKNTTYSGPNDNKVLKDEQVESGRSFEYGSSYNHTIFDEQNHITRQEIVNIAPPDNKQMTNETDEIKNKILKAKTTIDPEVVHEKLNQTERRTALLSNKIEHDANENRRLKWHYASTTVPYATTTGQKEEIMFVPYTKENPINISKRGSTKYIDTITTQRSNDVKPVWRYKENKTLDEAAVENQIYPVQVPAPNRDLKEDTTESIYNLVNETQTSTSNTSTETSTLTTNLNFENATSPTNSNMESSTTENATNMIVLHSTKPFESTTTLQPIEVTEENSTLTHGKITDNTSLSTETVEESSNLTTSLFTTEKPEEENSTLSSVSSTPEKLNEDNATSPENLTLSTPSGVTTTENDYISDQTTTPNEMVTLGTNETLPQYISTETTIQTDTPTVTTDAETTTPIADTSSTTFASHADYRTTVKTEDEGAKSTPTKIDDRTGSGRDLKNVTVSTPFNKEQFPETTVGYGNNVVKQSETDPFTTENILDTTLHTRKPLLERKPNIGDSTPDPSTTEDSTGNATTGSQEHEQEEGNGGKIAAIVISCIGAVCFIILAILLFVMRKRHKRFNYGQRCTPVSLDAYSVDNVSVYNSVRRKGMMRASKRSYGNPAFDESSITHLLNFPELIKFSSNTEGIASEFEDIPQISVQTAELPEGCEVKNRYANVIPLPESRVFLTLTDNCPNSDYINANYVTGPKSTRGYYIACQAPMQSTVDDFWRMIWEQQSRVILMLTHLFENGSEKCFDYLPPSEVLDCHRLFGDFQITLKKREVKEKYVISSLQLKNMVSNTWREVTHLWYLGWPERGVPSEESSLVAFLIEARSYVKAAPSENGKLREPTNQGSNGAQHSEQSPVVVHCSPGTGRTGTVIACDIAIREFELTRQVDIPKTVYQIRRNRAGAVQTKEQYAFIYRLITWYANKLTGGVLDSL